MGGSRSLLWVTVSSRSDLCLAFSCYLSIYCSCCPLTRLNDHARVPHDVAQFSGAEKQQVTSVLAYPNWNSATHRQSPELFPMKRKMKIAFILFLYSFCCCCHTHRSYLIEGMLHLPPLLLPLLTFPAHLVNQLRFFVRLWEGVGCFGHGKRGKHVMVNETLWRLLRATCVLYLLPIRRQV